MATEVKLPRLGQGMESGTITRWLKSEGDRVEKGEPLYELDTDKATQEVEAEASGVLLRIAVAEGEVEVGKLVAVIGEEGESVPEAGTDEAPLPGAAKPDEAERGDASAEKPAEAPAREPDRERGRAASVEAAAAAPAPSGGRTNGRVKASPLARRIARERGIDLAAVHGTGPEGRIVAEDVERAAAQAPAAAPAGAPAAAPVFAAGEVESRPLAGIRRTIARRMTEAWTIPVFHLTVSAEMTRADELVARMREAYPEVRVTVNDVVTKLCASALMRHREVNARFVDDAIELHPTANVGIAVALQQGLVVPVIPSAERRTIAEIAAVRADLVERARAGKLTNADLDSGTFTISNLGMYGIEQFDAVINPPQAGILAVGATQDRVVVVDGEPVVRPMLTMTFTGDHRSIDGATGAEFLRTLKASIEEPSLAL